MNTKTIAECANCDWRGEPSGIDSIEDLFERIDPGCEVPAGECPKCGCLAYLVTNRPYSNREAIEAAADEMLKALHTIHANAAESVEWIRNVTGPAIALAEKAERTK